MCTTDISIASASTYYEGYEGYGENMSGPSASTSEATSRTASPLRSNGNVNNNSNNNNSNSNNYGIGGSYGLYE